MSDNANADLYPAPVIRAGRGPGPAMRMLILGLILIGTAAIYFLFRNSLGNPFLLGLLGILAMIGVFYLFASVMGFIAFGPQTENDELSGAFMDSLPIGTIITDAKGRIVYANRAYAEATGATEPGDVRTIESILSHDGEAADVVYRLANAVRDGVADQEELRLSRQLNPSAAGGPVWYRVSARPFGVASRGRGPLFAWQIADISKERAEQERFFQDLQQAIDHLDKAPAGFLASDADGRIVYINATLAEWLGVDLTTFTPAALRLDDIIAGNGMALLNSIKTDPGTSRTAVVDLDLAKSSGQSLAVRFYHRIQQLRDGRPGPSRTIVLNRAEGADASAALRAAEVRFTRFFNSAPMAIAAVDARGRVLRTNARFLDLFSPVVDRDAIDRRIRLDAVVHERDREAFDRALAAAFRGQAQIIPVDTVLPDNEERHVRFYLSPVSDLGGEGVEEAAIVSAVDTTEQKALEAQMAQGQKMQAVGQLAGGIAHDFNNVLTAIIMASDLLLTNHRPSDSSFPDIMNIKQNANRAASLVRQLLAFSRRQTLRPEVLILTDVLADLRMLLARLVGSEVNLKIDHGRDLWPVKADLGQFEQVIVNLAVNARDAMPGGGNLTIRTSNLTAEDCARFSYRGFEPADYVMVEVEDTGVGIPAEVMEKIFEPFFTTKEVGKGTGLGLSMVYGIIKQTGGSIYCDSEVGKGTVFRIFLPRHAEERRTEATDRQISETSLAAGTEGAKKLARSRDLSGSATVLLVEDEDAVRMAGARALQSRGYTVHVATSGIEALDIMKGLNDEVDIVVSDVVMPEMDGPTLLRELRKHHPDIKFIFVSGYAEDAFAKNLPADAKFGFLPKPFSLKQLATAVKEMLED